LGAINPKLTIDHPDAIAATQAAGPDR